MLSFHVGGYSVLVSKDCISYRIGDKGPGYSLDAPWKMKSFSERYDYITPVFKLWGWRVIRLSAVVKGVEKPSHTHCSHYEVEGQCCQWGVWNTPTGCQCYGCVTQRHPCIKDKV